MGTISHKVMYTVNLNLKYSAVGKHGAPIKHGFQNYSLNNLHCFWRVFLLILRSQNGPVNQAQLSPQACGSTFVIRHLNICQLGCVSCELAYVFRTNWSADIVPCLESLDMIKGIPAEQPINTIFSLISPQRHVGDHHWTSLHSLFQGPWSYRSRKHGGGVGSRGIRHVLFLNLNYTYEGRLNSMFLATSIAAGRIGDIIGRKGTLFIGALVFTVGGAVQTFTTGFGVMVLGRIISGAGVGLLS